MRYNLIENNLIPVLYVVNGGMKISNPPDSLVDEMGLGYPFEKEAEPEYNAEMQYVTCGYVQEADKIVERATVCNKTTEQIRAEQNAAIDAQITAKNAEFETWKKSPVIVYENHVYQPSWLSEFYVPMLQDPESFPRSVWSLDQVSVTFEFSAFQALTIAMGEAIQERTDMLWTDILALQAQRPAVGE